MEGLGVQGGGEEINVIICKIRIHPSVSSVTSGWQVIYFPWFFFFTSKFSTLRFLCSKTVNKLMFKRLTRTDTLCSCQAAQALALTTGYLCKWLCPPWHHGKQSGEGERARGLGQACLPVYMLPWAACFWRNSWENAKKYFFLLLSLFKHLFIYCTKYLHNHCNCLALLLSLTNLQQGLVSTEVLETCRCSPWCSLCIWSPSKTLKARRLADPQSTWATRA